MSDSYTKAAFTLTMSTQDAALLRTANQACETLEAIRDDEELKIAFDGPGERFAAVFPLKGHNHFASFLELFDDPDYPDLDCDIDIGEPEPNGQREVTFSGEQFGIEQVSSLIFAACKSALPCGFAWSNDCDRLHVGEFGGGCVIITAVGVEYHSTTAIVDRAILRENQKRDEAADGYVLAIRDHEHGLSFWNHDSGFGRLALALAFSENEAASFTTPIADDEPEWLTMPAPLRHSC